MRKELRKILREIYEFAGNPKYSRPALNDLDKKLEKYLNFYNGFFIEVGANDGYNQSNTYYLEKFLGWRGILVEGIPSLYHKCKQTRGNSSTYNCALVGQNFTGSFVEMHYANLMSVVDGSLRDTQMEKQHIKIGLELQKIDKTYTIKVPVRTLESILDEFNNLPTLDFLSLDVEGYEINVLSGLNLQKYKPTYILVEARFFEDINSFLSPDYNLVEQLSEYDFIYKCKKECVVKI